jgi:hypothetical protein
MTRQRVESSIALAKEKRLSIAGAPSAHGISSSTGKKIDFIKSTIKAGSQHQISETGSEFYFQGKSFPILINNEFQKIMYELTESAFFTNFILVIIMLNTIMLVINTSFTIRARFGWYIDALDDVFMSIYIMEIVLKLLALKRHFFQIGWNNLDLFIVFTSVCDFLAPLVLHGVSRLAQGTAIFRALRLFKAIKAIRALRVLRTIR